MLKTLVILTPGFPRDEADSTCIPDRQIFIRVLKETYPELNIVVLAFQYPFKPAKYSWHGVNVIAIGGKNKSGMYRRVTWLRAWRQLKKLNKQNQLMGLLSFWLDECAFIADGFSKKYQLKHYCWLLGQDARPGNKYVKRINPAGENLIALSDHIVKEFKKNYSIIPRHVIPGAIDVSLFSTRLPEKDIDILGAGSLIALKQYGAFAEIIAALKNDFPEIKAVICGKGPEMQMLRHKIKQLRLQNNLTLLGEVPHSEVLTLMQRAKILMHTSNYEGFGVVCLEALYAGAKVVSFVRPMDAPIANWHIADSPAMMQQLIAGILNEPGNNYEAILPYQTSDTVKAVMQLFD